VIISGRIRSGKDTVADMVRDLFPGGGVVRMSFSDKLGEILEEKFGLPRDRKHLIMLTQALKTMEYGQGIFQLIGNKMIADQQGKAGLFVLCGARFRADLKIRDHWNATLVGVSAPFEVRYDRARRNTKDGDLSIEKFGALDNAPEEGDVDELVAAADFHITNDGTCEKLHEQVALLIEKLQA
jgi:dephospho-CoA kinase